MYVAILPIHKIDLKEWVFRLALTLKDELLAVGREIALTSSRSVERQLANVAQ